MLFTKGDAAQRPDEPVRIEELLGEVVSIERERDSVDLNNGHGVIWSLLISKVSPYSQFLYPTARLARRFLSRFA